MIRKIFLFSFLFPLMISAQSVTFDEFLDMSKNFLNVETLKSIKDYFPNNYVISFVEYGDITGDSKTDFAVAVQPLRTKTKNIYIFMFCDSLNQYIPFFSDTLDYHELPIEIGFNISNRVCYVTHKVKENNWTITGYSYLNNEFSLVDFYKTDIDPVSKKYSLGVEKYENYYDLNSFKGYYSLTTLKEIKKNKFFIHPVYDLKRNIYKGFKEKISIDKSWLWDAPTEVTTGNFGDIVFSKNSDHLILNLSLNNEFTAELDTNRINSVKLYFDRSDIQIIEEKKKKDLKFRTGFDKDIAGFDVKFVLSDLYNPEIIPFYGANFKQVLKDEVKLQMSGMNGIHLSLDLPIQLIKVPSDSGEVGIYINLTLYTKKGEKVILANSNGSADEPFSYGRLIFIKDEDHFGVINNYRFKKLAEKLYLNGLIYNQ